MKEKKKGRGKKVLIITGVIVLVLVLVSGIGLMYVTGWFHGGNASQYSVKNTPALENAPLQGQTILFLGSSVTAGASAKGESFADFLGKRDGVVVVKEAVSGTTLADLDKKSYVQRLQAVDASVTPDAVVVQLSTNDATKNLPLGALSDGTELSGFDTGTILGAIEYIIAYSRERWGCPVVFYTGTKYDSEAYTNMVDALYAAGEKWDIGIIDLWNDEEMNAVSEEDYKLYMFDDIHPTKAGYRDWWTPKMEAYLNDYLVN